MKVFCSKHSRANLDVVDPVICTLNPVCILNAVRTVEPWVFADGFLKAAPTRISSLATTRIRSSSRIRVHVSIKRS